MTSVPSTGGHSPSLETPACTENSTTLPPSECGPAKAALDFVHDEHFYFRSAVFRAGKTHFRVPIYGLPSEDGIFAAMFSMPNENGEGLSDENPIFLPPEVTAEDFRSLLKASIPMPAVSAPPRLTIDEWMSVLKLATIWCLDGLRAKAISAADKEIAAYADGDRIVDKILLAKQHRVSKWLIEGYEQLGRREKHLQSEERARLGMETSYRIWELREESWTWAHPATSSNNSGWDTPRYYNRNEFDFQAAVQSIFHDELSFDPEYEVSPSPPPPPPPPAPYSVPPSP